MTVRVRFAPSPTGYLHIGGARTALYNFLFARHEKGTFILRVEDTDQQRNTEESLQTILDGMKWLGFTYDEGPYFQSRRLDLYRDFARRLEKSERAYWREDPGKGRGLVFRIDREKIAWDDAVLGSSGRDLSQDPDVVILKSDGFPTYNFACVVDDADLRITHVIRGQEHLPNTPKQISLYRALGLEPPSFAHIPLIFDPKGRKVSKREKYDFPVTIEECRAMGFLPEAFVNFLALLGWSPGGDLELMSLDDMIRLFTLDRVNTSPARFLRDKLDWMNGLYIRKKSLDEIMPLCRPLLDQAYSLTGVPEEKIREAVRQQQDRLVTLKDVVSLTRFFFQREVAYEEKAVQKWLKADGAKGILSELKAELVAMPAFEKDPVESMLKRLSERHQVKLGKIAQPLRVAVTGGDASPPLHETLHLLEKERVLARIDAALNRI